MRIVALADTHLQNWKVKVPPSDIFIFAGDNDINSIKQLEDFNVWLGTINSTYKIWIGGNHDLLLENISLKEIKKISTNATYLYNSGITIGGVKFWGSPFSKLFGNWAFMRATEGMKEIWNDMPEDLDVLITHGPSYSILDTCYYPVTHNVGCIELLKAVELKKPRVHIVGHIHESYGRTENCFNVSVMDENYQLVNKPTVIDYCPMSREIK